MHRTGSERKILQIVINNYLCWRRNKENEGAIPNSALEKLYPKPRRERTSRGWGEASWQARGGGTGPSPLDGREPRPALHSPDCFRRPPGAPAGPAPLGCDGCSVERILPSSPHSLQHLWSAVTQVCFTSSEARRPLLPLFLLHHWPPVSARMLFSVNSTCRKLPVRHPKRPFSYHFQWPTSQIMLGQKIHNHSKENVSKIWDWLCL